MKQQLFQEVFLQLPDPCWVVNEDFKLVQYNKLASLYFEKFDSIAIEIGTNMVQALPEVIRSEWKEWYTRASKNESFVVPRVYDFQGNMVRFQISFQSLQTEEGRFVLVLAKDLSKYRDLLETLPERDRLLDIVFKAAPVGISLTNAEGKFVKLNTAFSQILGWDPEELLGESFTKIFVPEYQQQASALHNKYLAGEEVPPEEWVLKTKKGLVIHLSARIARYIDDRGQQFVVAVIADITNQKRSEVALMEAKQVAETAAKAKAEFLSNMSHEIRTPLNAVIGLTELLIKGTEPEMYPRYLESIKYSADNLLVIVNDILDFSKIESGKITLEKINFSIHKVFDQLMKSLVHKANDKGIKLKLTINDNVPDKLIGDPYRLNQVLMNLAGNALKFTREGSITIEVSSKLSSHKQCEIGVVVRDTGIGIPADKIDKVFESFTQAYADTTRLFGGSGLGLAISRNLARLLGGDIKVDSKVGKGSEFTLTVTYEMADQEIQNTSSVAAPTSDKADLSPYRFLLVEDNLMNQFVAIQILKRWKARVEAAENGEVALQMLKKQYYDLVFMDLQMPVMNGFETTQRIRDGEAGVHNQKIPILAMTADALHETRLRVLDSGMDDFITKPLDLEDLYSKTISALAESKHDKEKID